METVEKGTVAADVCVGGIAMAKGIIYIMTTAVPGLIKIGKTGSYNFDQRMYNLENNGYRNVTSLKRSFAIEIEDYDEKEQMIHTIFEKSRVADTELFAVDVNIVTQLLSSFDGTMIYPKETTKNAVFDEVTANTTGRLIPNGIYHFKRFKRSDNKDVIANAVIENGCWTLLKGSILGMVEDVGVSQKAKDFRTDMPITQNGKLLEDVTLGACSPSFAGCIVMNQSNNGWTDWYNEKGKPIDIYRQKKGDD